MRDPPGKLAIGSLRSGEFFSASANSLNKRFDIDDEGIGWQVALACSGRTILPLIEDWTSVARRA